MAQVRTHWIRERDGRRVTTHCGKFGEAARGSTCEFETATGDRFEAVDRVDEVTCRACLKAGAGVAPEDRRSLVRGIGRVLNDPLPQEDIIVRIRKARDLPFLKRGINGQGRFVSELLGEAEREIAKLRAAAGPADAG